MAAHPYLDHPGPLAVAHRGGAAEHPENSREAFGHAVSLGYRYLETDVHLSRDGHVVAFHDDRLDRVSDRIGRVDAHAMDELRRVRIRGTGTIATLDELLEEFPEHRWNIDPKSDPVLEPLLDVLRRHAAFDRVCLGSFSDARLARARALAGPALCTSAGPRAVARLRLASMGVPVRVPSLHCVQVPPAARGVAIVDARFVRAAHARGIQVHVWTVDDPVEMRRLLDLGVDGIMTDVPHVLREVLESRDAWHHHPPRT